MRKIKFAPGEYYHIYNRGVDHRNIVKDKFDADRLLQSLYEFNTEEITGGIYELSFKRNRPEITNNLVDIICYCLNPNHFHLLIKEIQEGGLSKYIHRFIGGYSKYFNKRYKRKGTLFEGPFKAKHISDNDYLLHASAYINLNDQVHQLPNVSLVRSSWIEYMKPKTSFCKTDIILSQFETVKSYKKFAEDSLLLMLEKRSDYKDLLDTE